MSTAHPKSPLCTVALLLLLGGLAGCNAAETAQPLTDFSLVSEAPFTLTVTEQAISGLHPLEPVDSGDVLLQPLLWEGLFTLDEHFIAQPLLCDGYTSRDDARVWTFYLRTDVCFSDGSPLTAEAVRLSLEAAREEGSPYAARLSDLQSLTVTGDRTLEVTLSEPNGTLPALLDVPIVHDTGAHPLGTGPYVWTEQEGQYALTAAPHWWQNKPRPFDTIPLLPVPDAAARAAAFQSHASSMLLAEPPAVCPPLTAYAAAESRRILPSTTMLYLGMNSNRGVCRSLSLRQALRLLPEREMLETLQATRPVQAAELPCLSTPWDKSGDTSAKSAWDILREAGYQVDGDSVRLPNGAPLQLRMIVSGNDAFKVELARSLVRSLQAQHIAVSLQVLTFSQYLEALEQQSFDLYLGEVSLTADFDLRPLLTPEGAVSYGVRADDALLAALQAWRAATGSARTSAERAFLEQFRKQAPFAVLGFEKTTLLFHDTLPDDWHPTPHNPFAQ